MEYKIGADLRAGDRIINVGTVVGEPLEIGAFFLWNVRSKRWDITTGTESEVVLPVIFHGGDEVVVWA